MSEWRCSQPSRRPAIPEACGIPPSPAACSLTRLLSVTANCPSRKHPSRGVVAIQFGLPRPAFRKADWVVFDTSFARLINSSLISNGLNASNFFSVRISAIICSFVAGLRRRIVKREPPSTARWAHAHRDLAPLREQDDQHHAPNRQQRVADRVSHRVAESGDLAFGTIVYHAERSCRGTCARAGAEQDGIVEAEQVLAGIHRQHQRHRRDRDTPQEQAEPELLQSRGEAWSGGAAG